MTASLPPSADGGQEEERELLPPVPPATGDENRDRKGLAESVKLDPGSLVGSWFHRVENGEMVWAGLIVGEIQAGTYLCQIVAGLESAAHGRVQVVVSLDRMEAKDEGYEYRFYDTEEHMRNAYAEFASDTIDIRKEVA